jgi:hypothetical protein
MMKRVLISAMLCSVLTILLVPPAISQQDAFLVGYWSFDEEGDVVEDQSGNGNDGTVSGDVNWVAGKFGTAIEFAPGANITIADSDTLRDMDEYTIAMWIKLNEFAPDWNHLFEKDGSYGITVNTAGGDFRFTPNSSKVWIESTVKVETDTWYYITLKTDGSSVFFYVDGKEVAKSDEPVVFNANVINIAHSAPYTVDGAFDEVKFWAKALTEDEIKAAMSGNVAVPPMDQSLSTTWAHTKTR